MNEIELRRFVMHLRQMPRAGSFAGAIGKEALDDPVFERMKGDDDETAARLQRSLCRKQSLGEFAEFIIDEDTQRLKTRRGGMNLVLGLARRDDFDETARSRVAVSNGFSMRRFSMARAMRPACFSSPRKPKIR